jgi:hypothetical protein
LPAGDLDCLCDEGIISNARVPQVDSGAPLEGQELKRWHEMVVERAFAPEYAIFWAMFGVKHPRNRAVYLAAIIQPGYECDEHPAVSFGAAYCTFTETMNALKAHRFTGPKDCQARSAEVLATR